MISAMRYRHVGSLAALALAVLLFTHASVADDETPAIVHLEFRDHLVTIRSSPQGPLYSVRTRSGEMLDENLSEEQLLAAHPKLSMRIRSGHAGDESGSYIWAGRDESLIAPPESFGADTE